MFNFPYTLCLIFTGGLHYEKLLWSSENLAYKLVVMQSHITKNPPLCSSHIEYRSTNTWSNCTQKFTALGA